MFKHVEMERFKKLREKESETTMGDVKSIKWEVEMLNQYKVNKLSNLNVC